jgi:peptide/nickel transport system permease protein
MITFVVLRVALPADVVDILMGEYGGRDAEIRKRIEKEIGLDSSIPQQYAEWLGLGWFVGGPDGILQGYLGESLHSGRSVVSELKRRVPVSFELGLWAQLSAIAFSIPLGVWSALKQDEWPDYGLRSFAILLNAVPGFWIAVLIITFGSLWFNWAPPLEYEYLFENPLRHFQIMILPAILIGLTPGAGLLRLVRTQMLEVLRQDYIRTAQAKGLNQATVLYGHALRNALIPVVTVIGVGLPNIIAGTVVFEYIFLIPGMGRYLVEAVQSLDYPVIEGLILVFALILILSVVLVDISYAIIDPRIRLA